MNTGVTPHDGEPGTVSAADVELAGVLEDYLADVEAGRAVDPQRLVAEHPAIAARLRVCLAGMQVVTQESEALGAAPPDRTADAVGRLLGDYRLLREVGRGGMGIVYEAEQLSLGRRVAVKILAFASTLDPRQTQRFQRESQAAAQLRHPNIVPVYAVGCDQGIHFYVMQFIEGRTLATLSHAVAARPTAPVPRTPGTRLVPDFDAAVSTDPDPATVTDVPVAAGSTPRRSSADCRAAALLMVQAAEALDHAHQMGVIHRDVKPANLLVDDRGHLWVTDFGLAQWRGDNGLTQTGDVVGTLRYMSPEQASAQRGLVDHRTDVYALGATLYELLAGRPPFDCLDRGQLLLHILREEPRPLRRLNPAVPIDLATVVHKSLAKDPAERYATAQDLADDLQRYLHDEPIHARPPTMSQHLSRWLWRNRRGAATAVGFLVLALVGLAVATGFIWQAKGQTEEALRQAQTSLDRERVTAYQHTIALAHREWEGSTGRTEELLTTCRAELRGWEWNYLKRLCHADQFTLQGQDTSSIPCLAVSPDGRLLAYAGARENETRIKIRDLATGREVVDLSPQQAGIPYLFFGPDGRRLISVDSVGLTKVWSIPASIVEGQGQTRLRLVRTIGSRWGWLRGAALDCDGRLLACGFEDRTVHVWDVETGKEKWVLRGHAASPQGMGFSPAGPRRLLVTSDHGGAVKLWDMTTGALVLSLEEARSTGFRIAFSPDGQRLVYGSWTEGLVVEVATGKLLRRLVGHTDRVYHLAFSRDGTLLASAGHDRAVRLWDASTGRLLRTFRGHTKVVFGVEFSADARQIFSCGQDGTLKVWDTTAGEQPHYLRGHTGIVSGVAFHPDNNLLASVAYDGTVKLWDVATHRERRTLHAGVEEGYHVRFSPDGRALASGHERRVVIWDSASGEALHTLAHPGPAMQTAFSPDGRLLAAAGRITEGKKYRTMVLIWDAVTGQQVGERHCEASDGAGSGVGFSPDGRYLAWSGGDGVIRVEERTSGREVVRCRGVDKNTATLGFSSDGRRVTAPGVGSNACVWDVVPAATCEERDPKLVLWGHTNRILDVAFSPDGRRLVTTSDDKLVKLWDARDGTELLSLQLGDESMESFFSPDGNRLAIANRSRTVLLLDGTPPAAP